MNKKCSLEKKITNSKFNLTKNFIYFMAVSALILIVGIILTFTTGFKLGTDFTGASSFKVYVNTEASLENAEVYDLSNKEDFDIVYGKIQGILEDNNLKIVSYRTSTMNLMTDYNQPNGKAVEVVFQNTTTDEDKINAENENVRQALLVEFDYSSYQNAISAVDYSPATSSFNWMIGILASIVSALAVAIIYMLFRYDRSAWIVLILQVALDIILMLGLVSICRLTVNLTVGIAVLTTFMLTIINAFAFYSKMKDNIKNGKFAGMKNAEMANANVKESLYKKSLIYVCMLILAFMLAIISVEGVREVALGIAIALIVTYFTSTFFTPNVWMIVYKERKKKETQN